MITLNHTEKTHYVIADMDDFTTEIPNQTITISGKTYTAEDARATSGKPSRLQTHFRKQEGEESFLAALSDFLAEWFDGSDTVKVHTSGSTGTPKALHVEKRCMMNSAMLTVSFLHLRRGENALLCMPLQYIAGKMVVVRALVAGLNLIPVTPCGHPLQSIDLPLTFGALIPMQVYNSLQNPIECERLKNIRHLIIGGGAVDPAIVQTLRSFPHGVWSTYGMTETLSHIALRKLNGPDASEWYTPFDQVALSLSDENTLVIDAPLVCPGRLTTNDIVEFNRSRQFRVIGRKDNTINTGGVKVQIEQVEAALKPLLPLPFLITSAPDIKFGERIVLLVQATSLSDESQEAVSKAIGQLPAYWRPKQTIPVNALPLTGTGKPDRATAKAMARDACNIDG